MDEQVISESNRFTPTTGVIPTLAPLTIDLEDKRLLSYITGLETAGEAHWNAPGPEGINLKERRKQNLKYLLGKQLLGRELKVYESEFIDNTIYEFEKILKALAVSKLPDIVIQPGGVGVPEDRKLTADLLTEVEEKYKDSDANKAMLGMMFKHMPVMFIAGKKYRWDPNKGTNGDIDEEVLNMENVLVDHTALTSNPDEMQYIIHYVEKTGKEWSMLFPESEEPLLLHIKQANPAIGNDTDENNDFLFAQKVRVGEAWYDWFDKAQDFDAKENPKFDFTSGVCWKLNKTTLLGKSKNPNWDYEGHDVQMMGGKPMAPDMMEQMVAQSAMTGQAPQGLETKRVFNNYFKTPRKPFIFMTFDQFLRSAIDETSRIEQAIPLQKSLDDVERQIDHMIKNHKGKHIWGSESGVTKKDLKKMDMDNPNTDAIVKGKPADAHAFIQPVMPPGEMFAHVRNRRDRIFAKVGAHGATRGEVTTDVATTNQISREGDFTTNDDMVSDTILHVETESAKARMHMRKLRYTAVHWKELAGSVEGDYLNLRINNDSIDDGMEVVVKASTTDKLRAERNAQNMASLQMIEPYYYYKDLGISDAKGRAEAIYLFNNNIELWYQKIVLGKDISALVTQVIGSTGLPAPAGAMNANGQVQPPTMAPQQPSPTDTLNVATTPQGGQVAQAATMAQPPQQGGNPIFGMLARMRGGATA